MSSTSNAVASSGRRRDDDVALLLEDPVHPVDGRLGLARRLDREDVVVLVLEVAGLVRPQPGERVGDRRRLQADGRDGREIHGVGHGSGDPFAAAWPCVRCRRRANHIVGETLAGGIS